MNTIEPAIRQLTEAELSTLEPSTVMGIAGLFLYAGLPQATEDLIFRYLGSRRRSILGAVGVSIPLEQKIFTEERCHRVREALDEPFVLELASQAELVVLVSRWPEIQGKFPTKSSLIVVPSKKRVLYQCYPEIAERVCAISGPGTFVVIGAGVPAKIIADRARQSGAVALDVGSLMDYMIGQKTRTIADLT